MQADDPILKQLADVIESRRGGDVDTSYVARLLALGEDAILKKIGEEATEAVMACKDGAPARIIAETADLWFHCLIMLAHYRLRPDDVLAGTLSRLVREPATRRLLVGGLPPAHCAHWIASIGTRGDAAALGEALYRETNGNPLFVGELVQLLAVEPDLASGWDRLRVPHGVHEVIARRLDRLGPECRATLATAALLGDSFDGTVLAGVLGDVSPRAHLTRAVSDRILVERDVQRVVQRYRKNLRTLRGIYIDCGWRDQYHIHYGSRILSKRLAEAGIRHTYEEFDDNHSDIDYRMDVSLPFLSRALRA